MKKLILTLSVAVGLFAGSVYMQATDKLALTSAGNSLFVVLKQPMPSELTKMLFCRIRNDFKLGMFIVPSDATYRLDVYNADKDCK